ncbi:hypothetical protein HKX48_003477 [Thoreauomyces humboldtii]|nr:hypothetical protein HKX48_003477 [Thoreauomyces humboldtii]
MPVSDPQLDQKLVERAVGALFAWQKNLKPREDQLLDEDSVLNFHIQVTTKRMPEKLQVNPVRIHLPNPLYTGADVCLITKDPQREYKDLLATQGVTGINKVIDYSNLRAKFKPYEARRQLVSKFDLFIADDRILPLLPKVLGKKFFATKKLPVSVDLKRKDLKSEFAKILQSTFLRRNLGVCNDVRIATTAHTAEQVVENIITATPEIIAKLPKKWANIHSIVIKLNGSSSLPIYASLPDAPVEPEVEAEGGKKEEEVEAEVKVDDTMEVTEEKEKAVKAPTKKSPANKSPGKKAAATTPKKEVKKGKDVITPAPVAATPSSKKATPAAKKATSAKKVTPAAKVAQAAKVAKSARKERSKA